MTAAEVSRFIAQLADLANEIEEREYDFPPASVPRTLRDAGRMLMELSDEIDRLKGRP